jgi:hypothetical protein
MSITGQGTDLTKIGNAVALANSFFLQLLMGLLGTRLLT